MGVKKKILNLANWIFPIGILVSLVIVWEVLVRVVNVPSWQLPPPSDILDELIVSKDLLLHHTLVTLKEIVV